MSYIDSTKIKVFPSARRVETQVSARKFSEEAVAGIINKLVDRDGFIITSTENYGINKKFEFNIHGYKFTVDKAKDIMDLFTGSTSKAIYGNVVIDTTGNYTELRGQDDQQYVNGELSDTSLYEGVQFTSAPISQTSSGVEVYSLLLFSRASTTADWKVPDSSRLKFNSGSVDFSVDGGEI